MYFILMIYLLFFSIFIQQKKIKKPKYLSLNNKYNYVNTDYRYIILLILPLVFVASFRALSVGTDTSGIYNGIYFNGYGADGWRITIYECLFKYLIRILYLINNSYNFFLGTCSLTICLSFALYFVSQKQEFNIAIAMLSFFVWIFLPSLNILRQILAISVCLYGTYQLEKDNVKKTCIIYFISCFIHITSIIMFVLVFLYSFRKKNTKKKILPIICVVAPLILMLCMSKLLDLSILSKFRDQIGTFDFGNINTKFLVFPLMMLPAVILNWHKLIKLRKYNYIHLCGYILIFVLILLSGFLWFAFRMMYFFIPCEIIIISQLSNCLRKKSNKIFMNAYIIFSLVANFFFIYVINDTDGVYPYLFGF